MIQIQNHRVRRSEEHTVVGTFEKIVLAHAPVVPNTLFGTLRGASTGLILANFEDRDGHIYFLYPWVGVRRMTFSQTAACLTVRFHERPENVLVQVEYESQEAP